MNNVVVLQKEQNNSIHQNVLQVNVAALHLRNAVLSIFIPLNAAIPPAYKQPSRH